MALLSVTIFSSTASLGDVSIGGQTLTYATPADEASAYTGTVTLPDDPTGLPSNVWCPMYFSNPGRYIWINMANGSSSGIAGAMCFTETTDNISLPVCPVNIQLTFATPGVGNLLITGNNGAKDHIITWNSMMQSPAAPLPTVTSVPLADAQSQTAAWRSFIDTSGILDPVYAYYISLSDLEHVLLPGSNPEGSNPVGGIRAYFALKDTLVTQTDGTELSLKNLHLFVVPVDTNGADMTSADPDSLIYDTTIPCPQLCNSGNPLFSLYPDSICAQR